MTSKQDRNKFIEITTSKLNPKELDWLNSKINIVSKTENAKKFGVFFSLASRFISKGFCEWKISEVEELKNIYPGFKKSPWTKLDLSRVCLMIVLDKTINKKVLLDFFKIAEMKEQISLYKGLFLLSNASEFSHQFTEGIRTNMVNVFDSLAQGNPFAQAYLNENSWNQLILKSLFMERKLYPIQDIDKGKNENLANMLQDYIKERWVAGREVSLEIWRMIDGFLRDDIKALIAKRGLEGNEKEIIEKLLDQNITISPEDWDAIGKIN